MVSADMLACESVVSTSFLSTSAYNSKLPNEIVQGFINGDAKAVGKYFNKSVELYFNDSKGVYWKNQAEQILRNFFVNNASANGRFIYKSLHSLERDSAQTYISELHTGKGLYRLTIYMKDNLIHRLTIDSND